MKIQVGGVSVELVEADDRVCVHARRGGFEPRTLQVWSEICATRRGTFLDVGAYTGIFAIAAALHGHDVCAFEPLPSNVARLVRNVEANGVRDRVRIMEAAASDTSGTANLRFNSFVSLTSGASLLARSGATLAVPTVTVDFFRLRDVAAIKIDVERAEPKVLAGARATIEISKPAIVAEVLDDEVGREVRRQLPGYELAEVMDGRNWLLLPC